MYVTDRDERREHTLCMDWVCSASSSSTQADIWVRGARETRRVAQDHILGQILAWKTSFSLHLSSSTTMADDDEVHGALDVLELTTVHYRPGDPFSVIFAYTTLTPLIILVALVTLLLFRRDLRTGLIFSGLLVNEVFNYVLKKIIKEARPPTLSMYPQ